MTVDEDPKKRIRALQRVIIGEGVDLPLGSRGFVRVGRRHTWVRDTGELLHIVNVWTRWGSDYVVQWGIRSEPVASILWGPPEARRPHERDLYDVAYSAITGRARDDAHGWTIDQSTTPESARSMAAGVATGLVQLDSWLASLATRRHVIDWLLADDDDHREATVPNRGYLRLLTAIAFLAVELDPTACELYPRLATLPTVGSPFVREREQRLREALLPVCQPEMLA